MSKPKSEEKERIAALTELRKEKWRAVFKANLSVLKGIRDDPDAKDKDRIEAARVMGRMMDVLSPEKIQQSTTGKTSSTPWYEEKLSEEDQADIDRIINSVKPN